MKRIFTFLLLLVTVVTCHSQTTLDFETVPTGQSLNWSDIGGGIFSGYVANPSSTSINTSSTVASILAQSTANGGQQFALINSQNLSPVTFTSTNCIVKIMIYKPTAQPLRLKFEGGPGGTQSPELAANYTTANVWQELVFDFTSEIGKTYGSLSILADYYNTPNRPNDITVYVDNISFNNPSTLPLDFETGPTGRNLNWSDIGGGVFSGYVANPSISGINISSNVTSILVQSTSNGGAQFALINSQNLNPVTFTSSNAIVKMMVYKSNSEPVRLKFEGGAGGSQSPELNANYTSANVWQQLTFDFSSEIGKAYNSLSILADFYNTANRPNDITVYVDNVSFNDVATLPITLVTFNGIYANFLNNLSWNTASELNFDKFEIRKSLDGKSFEKIGEIKGGKSNYTFNDNNINLGVTSYYQLRMVDNDGTFTLSNVIAVSNNKSVSSTSLTAYPIPASNQLTVNISSEISTTSEINIYDITGKIQSKFKENLKNGINNIEINTTLLKTGTYFLTSKTPTGNVENLKFIISK